MRNEASYWVFLSRPSVHARPFTQVKAGIGNEPHLPVNSMVLCTKGTRNTWLDYCYGSCYDAQEQMIGETLGRMKFADR